MTAFATLARCTGIALVLWIATSCALPWRDYPVSPALNGQLDPSLAGSTIDLSVVASVGALGDRATAVVAQDGSFTFERMQMRVAGREYQPRYQAFLNFHNADGTHQTIWRAEWFRSDTQLPVALNCDLERSTANGQPCLVENPTQHYWLVQLGQLEFLDLCSSCHGVGAVGGGTAASDLMPPPSDLTRVAARRAGRFDRSAILSWIDGRDRAVAHGTSAMPVWGDRLSRQLDTFQNSEDMAAARLDAVVTYIESVQRPAEEGD